MLVIFLFAMDATVVGTAMPTVVGKLGGLELYSWVFSAYMLTSALATALSGKLSDLYGQRRLILIGIALFTLASALCGMARSMEQLVIFRALQGVGGGAIYALSFIVVGFLFPPEQRAEMQGLISGVWGIASVLGPLAGGIITQYWSWRWIFFVNLPICFIAALLIVLGLAETRVEGHRRPDLKGAITLLLGLSLLFYTLEESQRRFFAFDATLGALLVSALLSLGLFYALERRSEEPLLPPGLFRLRLFRVTAGIAWVASMGMFGLVSYLPLYVQGVLGGSASRAGLVLLLLSLGWTAGSFSAASGINRFGYRAACAAGMLLMALGYGFFIGSGDRVGFVAILAIGAVIGVGMGIVTVTSMVAAQNGVPLSQLGVATSTIMLCRMFGGAFGINLLGGVLFSQMQRRLASLSSDSSLNLSDSLIEKLANPQSLLDPSTRALIPDSLLASLSDILGHSIWYAFLTGFFVMLFGFGFSFLMADPTPANSGEAQT
ncbi:MAG TPA: MDR family MFS transporter [Candidatus Binatia bacterium]|nr:MDR family MFS transporter [Candidatus Binatia bacterium]